MGTPPHDPEVAEAVGSIQQYLSDNIAPIGAVDAMACLMGRPAGILAPEIRAWVASQYQGQGAMVPIPDYYFHAAKKLHALGQLRLIPQEPLAQYLKLLSDFLLEYCPVEDRALLKENLENLGRAEDATAAPLPFVYRQVGATHVRGSRKDAGGEEDSRRSRRFSLLLERLETLTGSAGKASAASSDALPRLLAAVAENSQSGPELRRVQEIMGQFGMESGIDQVFRTLSRSLPGWAVAVPQEADPGQESPRQNSVVEAMRQIIRLAEDSRESGQRFHQLVLAAVEQFNEGSLARAVTILELADSLIADGRVDVSLAKSVRGTAHQILDSSKLKALAESSEKHHLLRRVLEFFSELQPEGLLESLRQETQRDRRRLLLSLLEVYGNSSRAAAFNRLESFVASHNVGRYWYYPRNLIYLLHRIPRPEGAGFEEETDLLDALLRPGLPAPLVREVTVALGQIGNEKAEKALLRFAAEVEQQLLRPETEAGLREGLKTMLDRAILALAKRGTPGALRAVVDHGLKGREELGNTHARLSYLSNHNLSTDDLAVGRLLKAIKDELPYKVLGVALPKNTPNLVSLIKALSLTPSPAVRALLAEVAAKFASHPFGRTAATVLADFSGDSALAEDRAERLIGDLELFGLPDLLQQLARAQTTGTLTLKDQKGEAAAALTLRGGKMLSCHAGMLQDEEAVYYLVQKPLPGTFVFMGRRDAGPSDEGDVAVQRDLLPIVLEGVRRYNDYQRACAIAPDGAVFARGRTEPGIGTDLDESMLTEAVWKMASGGATPEECEAASPADSLRIRQLLAQWVEESHLVLKA